MEEVWRQEEASPAQIEAALRAMIWRRELAEDESRPVLVPARVLNLVAIVDADARGEIEARLRRVGRMHPSRLVICAVQEGRQQMFARGGVAADDARHVPGRVAVAYERVEITLGPKHLSRLTRSSICCSCPIWRRWCGRRMVTTRAWTRCGAWRRSC